MAALNAVHQRGFLHNDIHVNDFLISNGRKEMCYLIDFGFAGQPESKIATVCCQFLMNKSENVSLQNKIIFKF